MQTLSQRKQEVALLPQTNMKGLVLLILCYAYSIALFLVAAWVTSVFITLKGTVLSKIPFSHLFITNKEEEVRIKESDDHVRASHVWGQR